MGSPEKTGQELIDEMAGGYRASQVLLTANRLGLFQQLADTELSAEEIAESLETDLRATRILCDALVSLSLLEKKAQRYKNTFVAKEYLLPGNPQSKVAQLYHSAKLYETWRTLYDVVKTGRPAGEDAIDPRLIGDKRKFAEAMADTARAVAGRVAVQIDLSGAKKMLDLGGGPGLYSIAFVHRYPQLQAVIMDNAETLVVARDNVVKAELAGRISVRPGDAFQDDMGAEYDFVLLSNVAHIYSAEENRQLVSKCGAALNHGGMLCIKDFLLDSDRVGPRWATLFAVNMLVNTERGNCYTLEEITDWFESAGLTLSDVVELTPQSRLVLAHKR